MHLLLYPSTVDGISLPPLHQLFHSALESDPSAKPRLYLAAALTPYRSVLYLDHKERSRLAVEAAIRDGVKLGNQNHYLDGIPALFQATEVLKKPQLGGERERVNMGTLVICTIMYFR